MLYAAFGMYHAENIKLFKLYVVKNVILTLPPDDEQLSYSKHVDDIVKNKTQEVHLVGSII